MDVGTIFSEEGRIFDGRVGERHTLRLDTSSILTVRKIKMKQNK